MEKIEVGVKIKQTL